MPPLPPAPAVVQASGQFQVMDTLDTTNLLDAANLVSGEREREREILLYGFNVPTQSAGSTPGVPFLWILMLGINISQGPKDSGCHPRLWKMVRVN